MYNKCDIFVNSKTFHMGYNLKELLKYLHIPTKLNTLLIDNNYIKKAENNTLLFILYDNETLNKLNINITFQIYFFLIEKNLDSNLNNYKSNIITTISSNVYKYFVPSIPLPDDNNCDNIDNFFILKVFSIILNKNVNFDIIYKFALYYNYSNIKKVLSVLNKDNKEKHRYICFQNIDLISNIHIKEFGFDKSKETVLIEFREFPHVEFLLRNMIHKLPKEWNHTIICGKQNYNMMINISNKICKNVESKIKVIKLQQTNLDRDQYCELLTSKYFWNLFIGEHILLYQEDTMLFHGNIEPFLKYDYIGAPWKKTQDDNRFHVGNGGFSLRTKSSMLRVINLKRNLIIGKSTMQYMKNSNLSCIPEDVYFSKSLIDFNLGTVSQYNDALHFSQEAIKGDKPLGGHAFWQAEPKKKIYNVYKLNNPDYYLTVSHRGGWKSIITSLINNNVISDNNLYGIINNNILLLDVVEKYFIWDKNNKIIEEDWVGIIHIVPHTPNYMKNIQIENLLMNKYFIESIRYCKGIIVLSSYLLNYLKYKIPNVKLKHIKHPVTIDVCKKFSIEVFNNNIFTNKIKIVLLGSQLRYLSTIYKIKSNFNKLWLPGRKNKELLFHWLNRECSLFNITITEKERNNVTMYYTNNYKEYDNIILNNIIIIHLINASANNAILELMYLNIPFFINKLDAVIEYIGNDYPLYFNSLNEIEEIINNKELLMYKIKIGYEYLKKIDKHDISIDYFNSEMLKFINE